jgi:general secretion pathway protein N
MKHLSAWLVALGLLALLGFALATLPAAAVSSPLRRAGIEAASYDGSLWAGRATAMRFRGVPVGDVQWTLTPLPLLRGRAAGHARIARPDGSIEADYDTTLRATDVAVRNATVSLPIATLTSLPLGIPRGWQGRVSGRLDELRLEQRWPTALRGTFDIENLISPRPQSAALGSFRAVFPHPAPQPSLSVPNDPSNLTARVVDKQGPFALDAQLTIGRKRAFSLDGTLAPRQAVPPNMQRALQMLGPADASGRRQFSVGGSL